MTHEQLLQLLTDTGLRTNEAQAYLTALTLGPCSILKLARASNIKRTTLYSIMEELRRQGLIHVEIRGFKKKFVAADPTQLEQLLEQRKQKLQSALPELNSLYNLKGADGSLKYYEGLAAVKSVYEQLLKDIRAHEDYLVITDLRQWLALDERYFLDFIQRRAKLPINIRMLVQDSAIGREHQKRQKNFNELIRLLPNGTKLTTNLVITPKRVVIHQLIPPIFAIVIQHPSIIQLHREQFEIIWKSVT